MSEMPLHVAKRGNVLNLPSEQGESSNRQGKHPHHRYENLECYDALRTTPKQPYANHQHNYRKKEQPNDHEQ